MQIGPSDAAITLPPVFTHNVVVKWGDPVLAGALVFDLDALTTTKQAAQFGFNCDYVDFRPRLRLR